MKKIVIVNNLGDSTHPVKFLDLPIVFDHEVVMETPEEVGLVVFCGGADVSPSLYGHDNVASSTNPRRDVVEAEVFNKAVLEDIPMFGICRGAQLICALSGGKLIQDLTGHAGGNHGVMTREGRIVEVNSCHHQNQYPWTLPKENYELLAWAEPPRSKHYVFGTENIIKGNTAPIEFRLEPDCLFYKKTINGEAINALAVQYHPEWLDKDHEGFIYTQELISEFITPALIARGAYDGKRKSIAKTAG